MSPAPPLLATRRYPSTTTVRRRPTGTPHKHAHRALTTRLEGVYADVSAATGVVSGNILLFTEDGRELKQEVLEELWERGGGASSSVRRRPRSYHTLLHAPQHTEIVYLFNRETFFSEPERWAAELREEVILPPPLLRKCRGREGGRRPRRMCASHLPARLNACMRR